MPGRQSHGRSLAAAPKKAKQRPGGKASKNRSQKNALNAFGIAQDNFAPKEKKTPRARLLDAEIESGAAGGGGNGDDDEDEDEEFDEDEGPQRKKVKAAPRKTQGGDVEYGSDSEGNEWQLGGMAEDDEDSDIDSDEAFGDSDDDKFKGYSFKGSRSRKEADEDSEDDSNDDEGETLGADAIDLATALDQYESESEQDAANPDGLSGSEEDEDSEDSDDEDEDEDEDDDEDEEADPEKLAALQGMVSGFGKDEDETDKDKPQRQKLDLSDLGLSTVDDPHMRNALKLMRKEDKEKRPGSTKKLDIPLSRREQGRIDRDAAYEQTNKTMSRWYDTIMHNREAEHLVFPLPQNDDMKGVETTEIKPLTAQSTSNNELGSAILGIMEQSGMSLEKESKPKEQEYDEEGNLLSRKQIQNRKRKEREANAREAKRQRRIKKIKSKAYRRVHRKEKGEGDEEDGEEVDSEAEREAQDRRRALERVGQRHKESKWAKIGNKHKRAVWDDDFRTGLTEMARRDEELRRRKTGQNGLDDDSDTSSDGSDSEDSVALLRKIDALEEESDGEGRSQLENLKFMRDAAARKKEEEKKLLNDMRRTLKGEEPGDSDEDQNGEVGRREYGGNAKAFKAAIDSSRRDPDDPAMRDDEEEEDDDIEIKTTSEPNGWKRGRTNWEKPAAATDPPPSKDKDNDHGGWAVDVRRKRKHADTSASKNATLELTALEAKPAKKPRSAGTTLPSTAGDPIDADTSDEEENGGVRGRNLSEARRSLLERAFAGGDDDEEEFEREKREVAEEEGDKVIDNTLPGWGSWVGDGVGKRERDRHRGRFLTKVEGVKKGDRKDAKLQRVIINEKRVKKVRATPPSPTTIPFLFSYRSPNQEETADTTDRTTSTSRHNCRTSTSPERSMSDN